MPPLANPRVLPGPGQDPSALGILGLDLFQEAADPTSLQNAFASYLEQILGPALRNQLTAAGMGRSGAESEALASAGVQMAPQVAAARNQALQNWAQAVLGMWGPMWSRFAYPPVVRGEGGGGGGGGGGLRGPQRFPVGGPPERDGGLSPWEAEGIRLAGQAGQGLIATGVGIVKDWLTDGKQPSDTRIEYVPERGPYAYPPPEDYDIGPGDTYEVYDPDWDYSGGDYAPADEGFY